MNAINEKHNRKTIAMAIYKFAGYGMDVEEFQIIKETEKSYIVMTKNNDKYRLPKEEIGKVIHHTSDFCPYVRVYLLNATTLDAKEKLAEWFEYKANYIRK